VAEACCLTTNLVRHPSVTLTSDALYRLRDVSRQSVIGTRLQQQPNNCQLVEQSTPTHCISLLHATKEQVVLFQANVSVWSLSYFSYLTIRHDSKVFNVQSKNWWIASLVYHTQSETKKKQEIRSVELGVCPMQLFHFRSRDVHPVQNLLLCTKFHRNLMIFRWYGIQQFSKWRPSANLELFYHHTRPPTKSLLLDAVACQISCQSDTQIWRYSYLNFSHIWLDMPIQAPKMAVLGDFGPLNVIIHHRDPPKGTSLHKSTSFTLSTVKIRWRVWPVGELTESATDTHTHTHTHSGKFI